MSSPVTSGVKSKAPPDKEPQPTSSKKGKLDEVMIDASATIGVGHNKQDDDFGTALFVAAMNEGNKTTDDIKKHINFIVKHEKLLDTKKVEYLQTMTDAIILRIEQAKDKDRDQFHNVLGQIELRIGDLQAKIALTQAAVAPLGRVASITVGLDEKLKYHRDLIEFREMVEKLFCWFNDDTEYSHTQYMAPYFPIIQSSGSGKTRLFRALVEVSQKERSIDLNYRCVMILLQNSRNDKIDDGDLSKYFDKKFTLTYDIPPNFDEKNVRGQVWTKLNNLVKELRDKNSGCEKFVLLFDEAQNWIDNDGFAIRCVRWWLRMSRETKIVAVFAGTTSSLANFYRDTAPIGGSSRDAKIHFVNFDNSNVAPRKLYPPFFRLCSIGCYHSDDRGNEQLSDFHRGAFYGRPLFAHLQKKDGLNFKEESIDKNTIENNVKKTKICNSTLHSILLRMVLSETDWKNNSTAICSILGSRVQMGITTSFVTASTLVSQAYAYLVHFHPDEASTTKNAVARIVFMPDPVCAALAMGLMDEHWMLDGNDGTRPIRGQAKTFWSEKAMELFKSGLCMPEKGNPGEIMVALYLLFCGDLLRSEKESTLRDFSVSLDKWFSLVKNGKVSAKSTVGAVGASDGASAVTKNPNADATKNPNADVNFIQVCRNYFRGSSWCTRKGLEWMYKSATASYVYPDCPAIDLVASIRVKPKSLSDDYTYHPLLVSVKCHKTFNNTKMKEAMTKMATLLQNKRKEQNGKECPAALCLLVLIGQDKTTKNAQDYQKWGLDDLDTLGAGGGMDIFRFITVPDDDQFGISGSLRGMTTAYSLTEIFSSHGYAYGEDSLLPKDVLRAKPGNDETELVESLCYFSGSADDGTDKDES